MNFHSTLTSFITSIWMNGVCYVEQKLLHGVFKLDAKLHLQNVRKLTKTETELIGIKCSSKYFSILSDLWHLHIELGFL